MTPERAQEMLRGYIERDLNAHVAELGQRHGRVLVMVETDGEFVMSGHSDEARMQAFAAQLAARFLAPPLDATEVVAEDGEGETNA